MTSIYILGLSYANSTPTDLGPVQKAMFDTLHDLKGSAQLEVRAGYFGLCVRQRGILWLCSSDSSGLAETIGPENDPLDLIGAASSFRDDVLFSGLIFMSVVLVFFRVILLATFSGWHEERDVRTGSDVDVKSFPSRPVSQVALACTFVGSVLLLVASLWQHVGAVGAAAMAARANMGNVKTSIGAGAIAIGWISFTLTMIVTIGLLVMILSIVVLDRLTDD
jgi:hypothetical protein